MVLSRALRDPLVTHAQRRLGRLLAVRANYLAGSGKSQPEGKVPPEVTLVTERKISSKLPRNRGFFRRPVSKKVNCARRKLRTFKIPLR